MSRAIVDCGCLLASSTAGVGGERTGDADPLLKVIVGNYNADDSDPADGVVQVEPYILAFEAGPLVERGVDVFCRETGPAAEGWRMGE